MNTTNVIHLNDKTRARFWAKVSRKTSPDECWEWKGTLNAGGRGRFTVRGTTYYAYRLAWMLFYGEIRGAVIRHRCGNPACCRLDHLVEGGQRENCLDTVEQGRHRTAKLDYPTVEKIRRRAAAPDRPALATLADQYGVSTSAIGRVVRGQTWPRAGGPITRRRQKVTSSQAEVS